MVLFAVLVAEDTVLVAVEAAPETALPAVRVALRAAPFTALFIGDGAGLR
jgi:hypothetical protein